MNKKNVKEEKKYFGRHPKYYTHTHTHTHDTHTQTNFFFIRLKTKNTPCRNRCFRLFFVEFF
jgi:hypothetical protein